MHLDEATPHLHIDFIPIAHKVERGLSVKVSMKGALKEQGFTSANRLQNEWAAWEERERDVMTDILHKHDLSRDIKNVRREHLTVDEYKDFAAKKQEIRNVNAHINELKKKNPAELTPDEIELIRNQNDLMRSEIQKRDEKISSLSRKLGAKFVPFEIFSEDKLQFVAAELSKINVPFVEENNTLHIPDYAQKTAAAVAESFRPIRAEGVREKIKLEIDRLVYCSQNLDDLYNKLRERGYQIKSGKYFAVKPTFAERFVQLKTLGEAYVPKNLEQRIADRDKFPNAVREKFRTANPIEKKFHITVMDMVVEVKQFTLVPRKLDPKKIYAFQNGAEIIVDNCQCTLFGAFAPNSKTAEAMSQNLGKQTVLSGTVTRSSGNGGSNRQLQMIERSLMTVDELKSMPKGHFIVMKTGCHPMKTRLKLFFKWGIQFEEAYSIEEKSERKVQYADCREVEAAVLEKFPRKPSKYKSEVVIFTEDPPRNGQIRTKNIT